MSIYGGMFSGVSALAAQSTNFGIISDNIANVNTVGYKDASAEFQTLVTESLSASRYTPGGVLARPTIDPEKQGLIQGTTSDTDIAMIGDGFFVVNEASTPGTGDDYLFTRAGSFRPDDEGNLSNTAGYFLQGWQTNQDGTIVNATTQDLLTSLTTVNVTSFNSVANQTQNIALAANLPAERTIGQGETTNITVFDSLGADHLVTINWTKTALNTWTYSIDVTNSAGTTSAAVTANSLTFDGLGRLATVDGATATANSTLAITSAIFASGATASSITIDWGTLNTTDGMAQVADEYDTSLVNQDGSAPSTVTGVEIDGEGFVTALFENGDTRRIYKLAVANVPAPTELRSVNGNAFALSANAGDLVLNEAGTQGAGFIESEALEQSTVDLSGEFTDMIITQRAYSAATRLITTGDELLEEIIRVKR